MTKHDFIARGLLNGYNYKTVGFDKHLLAFLEVDPDAFEKAANEFDDQGVLDWIEQNAVAHSAAEIELWNEAMIPSSRHRGKESALCIFVREAGGAGRTDLRTYFDLIEFDGRLK